MSCSWIPGLGPGRLFGHRTGTHRGDHLQPQFRAREIFEEAAGISKYRYRRGEAQRRLDAAEENMLRLRDILSELEGRVEPLRKEAEKAREYLALADERRTLEIGVWLAKIDQLSAQYRELQDKFLAARGEYDSLAREEEGMEERINLLYTQMQDCAVTADGLRTRLREWGGGGSPDPSVRRWGRTTSPTAGRASPRWKRSTVRGWNTPMPIRLPPPRRRSALPPWNRPGRRSAAA